MHLISAFTFIYLHVIVNVVKCKDCFNACIPFLSQWATTELCNQLDAQDTLRSCEMYPLPDWMHCSENCTGNISYWSERLVCVGKYRPTAPNSTPIAGLYICLFSLPVFFFLCVCVSLLACLKFVYSLCSFICHFFVFSIIINYDLKLTALKDLSSDQQNEVSNVFHFVNALLATH